MSKSWKDGNGVTYDEASITEKESQRGSKKYPWHFISHKLEEMERNGVKLVWVDGQCAFDENALYVTTYYTTPNGGMILRKAMEPNELQSREWCLRQARKLGYTGV